MLNKNDIDQLLSKYLLQETTPAERQAIEEWISSHPEHQDYFIKYRRSHIHLQTTSQFDHIQGHCSTLLQRIHRRTLFRQISRIAAIVLVVIGSGLCFYLLRQTDTTPTSTLAESIIQPGSSQAILHLSSGTAIPVNTSSQELKEQDGTIIRITDQGVIDYSKIQPSSSTNLTNRLEIPRGGEFKLSLADGTEVWLNSETELQYPTSFTTPERRVKLHGEAYFKVAKNENCPFIVETDDIEIKVYGTQFNINTHQKDNIETVLVSGSVSIKHQGQETLLKPSQKGAYNPSSGLTIEEVQVLPYITWKDGNFMFQNESLESIMEKLARWYDLDVFYLNNQIKNIRLSGMMERYKNVDELFHYFEKISSARFTTKGRMVTIE